MTDLDDPLLPFLIGELDQIEEAVGLNNRLIVPTVTVDDASDDAQTLRWTFRFTWQQVERGRRYVIPLPRETASQALQPVIAEINQIVLSALATDPRVVRNNSSIEEMRAELEALALAARFARRSLRTDALSGSCMMSQCWRCRFQPSSGALTIARA